MMDMSYLKKIQTIADSQIVWAKPDHNKEIFAEHNGMVGSVIPSNGWYEWDVSDLDGKNIDTGEERNLDEAKKIVESILKEHKGYSKCRSCGKKTDASGLCDKCYKK